MDFNLESRNNEIQEISDNSINGEKLSETEETAENFDDCSLKEVKDGKGNEVNSETLESAEDDFEDCESRLEKIEDEHPELADDEYDDFNDCGKETDGEYVAEVTYSTDGEISYEEANNEIQEAYDECDNPEDMSQLKENANENEHIEVDNAEVIERPQNTEMGDEVTEEECEEAQKELNDAQEELEEQQESAQRYQEELENQINKHENKVPEGTENTINEAEEISEETEATDEVEKTTEEIEDSGEAEEATEEIEDSDKVEEIPEEIENSGDTEETTEETEVTDETSEEPEDTNEVEETSVDTEDTEESEDSDKAEDTSEEIENSGEAEETTEETEASDETSEEPDDISEFKEVSGDIENTEEIEDTTEESEDTDETKETSEWIEDSGEVDEVSEKTEDSGEGKETAEGTENTDETKKTTEETEDSDEVEEHTVDPEDEEVSAEDEKYMEDDSEIEISEIDEESLSEDVSQEVEEKTDTELSDETKEQIAEEVSAEINSKADNNEISAAEAEKIIEEKKAETVETLNEQSEAMNEEIEQKADEIAEQDNLTEEEAKEQISDEVSENTSENFSDDDVDAMVEEKSETIEETIEEKIEEQKAVDSVIETSDELEDEKTEQLDEQSEQSLQERIDGAFEKEDVTASVINSLRDEHTAELQAKIEEKSATEEELKTKFDEVLSKKKGTDEYRQSLQEYNALQDKKADLDEQIASMEKQQERLEKRSIELREAQIQRGSEAVVASVTTLSCVNMLQERFDQAYYDTKADKTELANIRNESCSTIKELSDEKDSIRQAMDAKMDEIAEYVISNNMERYDTAHDPHYQQLITEYNAMKEIHGKIGYFIVKLDENNKAITEQLGDEYVSMVELPPSSRITEVNDGTDVPGETNYFIDETKANEVLSTFKQSKWEQLTVQEQKCAIEQLADYNAEVLGVDEKPRIVYYRKEDPSDFGGYSSQQNAIYINEYNLKNAAETADTISHEYRHKYQHERAEKLENERDLAFKEGFENYIRAENDYQGYKEQLVESDARAYAQSIKDKINAYSETSDDPRSTYVEHNGLGADYQNFNPEKGEVFEKIAIDKLPEDFEKKDYMRYKEVLEGRELDELRAVAGVHYNNGKAIWGKLGIQELESYKEHNDIESGHIEKVRIKSLEAAEALEAHFSQNNYGGLYSPNIDRRTIEVMSIYHDTGMDGNIKAEDYETERSAFISNEETKEKFVASALAKKENEAIETGKQFDREAERKKAVEKFEREGFENHFRPNHSLESAIHALRDRDSISKLNVSADEVALGCLVHSKSNSGLRNIVSEKEWGDAVKLLQDRVDEFNQSHPDEQIHFDSSFLLNEDGSFNQEKLAEMRSESIVLRIGDANGHDTNSRTSQSGKAIKFTLEEKIATGELPGDFESKLENGDYEPFFLEIQSADVKVDGVELNNENDPKGFSRMFAVGEGNFQLLNCEVDNNGVIRQNFDLCDGDAFPLSTQYCIEERLGEYKTAQPMKYTPVVKLGSNCSDKVYKSYLAFADRIERDYNVKMEVAR